MIEKVENPFISFYGEHNISPVRQDIRDFRSHILRREKLFRSLGMPPVVFSNKRILEIGPGGGYNALVFFQWGAKVDFVEPNPKAQKELQELLDGYGVGTERWRLFESKIEDVELEAKYDVIIAEGFIPSLYDRDEIIAKISHLINPGGVIVITCMDDISCFFDLLKRLVGQYFIYKKNILNFNESVAALSRAFEPHLRSLKYASRLLEDWVMDQFFTPYLESKLFSISECIEEFGAEFAFLGSSPSMFTDYSWYKDTDFDYQSSILEQFNRKKHVLMYYKLSESFKPVEFNDTLEKKICGFRNLVGLFEDSHNSEYLDEIVDLLREISEIASDIDRRISDAINEAIRLLTDNDINEEKIANADKMASAFGKAQQYVSLVKKSVV
jgi:2-polyprenyl-3-methyl-5-hydroxy-6-metoxy-1,4-benzoquinol methylase